MYYRKQCRDAGRNLDQDDVMGFQRFHFIEYMRSAEYQEHMACGSVALKGNGVSSNSFGSSPLGDLTVQEFCRGIKRDKTHYEDLKDDKYFNSWNRGFVATAHMHHTHLVLDEAYTPVTDVDKAVFK
jgi:hypothetical protein